MPSNDEIDDTVRRDLATRDEICAGNGGWESPRRLLHGRCVFVDQAWGRVEGSTRCATPSSAGEAGLDDWTFPTDLYAIVGDTVRSSGVSSSRADGRRTSVGILDARVRRRWQVQLRGGHPQHGPCPRGHGRLRLEAKGPMNLPPADPNRDFSRPERTSAAVRAGVGPGPPLTLTHSIHPTGRQGERDGGYRVIQWATATSDGREEACRPPELELAGCWVHSADQDGVDVGTLLGREPVGHRHHGRSTALLAARGRAVLYSPLFADQGL